MKNPDKYPVMPGTGGLRKARIALDNNKEKAVELEFATLILCLRKRYI